MSTDDLASIFSPPPEATLRYSQGTVIAWEPGSGRNTIDWFGTTLENLPVVSGINALTIQANDLVGMLGWTSPGGISTWWVLGTIVAPGDGATDLVIRGGDIVIVGGSLFIREAGGINVEDGTAIVARYPSGSSAAYFGGLDDALTGQPLGHGLLTRRESGPFIMAAYEALAGEAIVFFGRHDNPVDSFIVDAASLDLFVRGPGLLRMVSDGEAGFGGNTATYLIPEGGTGTANVRMDTTNGRITWVTSSARTKRDIQDLDVDLNAALALQPRSWLPGTVQRQCPEWAHAEHSDDECHAGECIDPDPDARREVGFIAEELDELGLVDFVEYDAEGLPISIRYDRLTAALIPLAQRQQAQIDALTATVETLAARVAALEPAEES